jgi:hypothetical protein
LCYFVFEHGDTPNVLKGRRIPITEANIKPIFTGNFHVFITAAAEWIKENKIF